QPSPVTMPQSRSLLEVEHGNLDVCWSVATRERDARLRAISIPIDFGLIGWRVLLIRRDAAAKFSEIRTLSDLAPRTAGPAGQGHDWPDLPILRANGLTVVPSSTYEGLFQMLARRRIDYVPRAVSEFAGELDEHASLPLAIEPALMIHYPSAIYFFVARGNE